METKKSFRELLLITAKDAENNPLAKDSPVLRLLMEENRFMQDCRKRALDLAHNECIPNLRTLSGGEIDVIAAADKYYNWLISIPN